MKKLIILSLLAFASILVNAQIPNSGFETWVSVGNYSNPGSWGTMNNTTASSNIFTATKGTPGSPGTAYLKLTSETVGNTVVNGIAVSGKLDSITKQPKSGFAFAGRPTKFTGKWQHMIYGTSQGGISVTFTRWNSGTGVRETVGSGSVTLSGMAMSWANFTINITYQNNNTPDSCIIFMRASGTTPAQDDYLWVDNLAFTYSAPTVTTTAASGITSNSAVSGGNVTNDGGAAVTARGVCWGTTANPTISGNHTSDGTGAGTFTSNISGLNPSTTYNVRAYATNSVGTSYGPNLTFTTTAFLGSTISGNIVYNNTASTPMSGVTVNLLSGTFIFDITTTDVSGNFSFTTVPDGTYSIEPVPSIAWGGVTSTDVLKMKRHIAGLELLTEPIRISAADVNNSGTVTSTDALKVSRRISGLDASFTKADWLFQIQGTNGNTIVVSGGNVVVNILGICTGDVNGSFVPAK